MAVSFEEPQLLRRRLGAAPKRDDERGLFGM